MTRQRRTQRSKSFGKMSFVERAGLLFGIVTLLADGTTLFTFATGVSNIHEYIPPSIPTPSALLFFSLLSGLLIIYGWFAISWYLVRRTFVLLGQMPIRFHAPLVRRSIQTVAGIGVFLIPLAIAWSVVNLPDNFVKGVAIMPTLSRIVTPTPSSSLTQTITTPTDTSITETPAPIIQPPSEEDRVSSGWVQYFMFCFPFFFVFFGFVVWLPINLLMPIVHVELLLEGINDDVMDELLEYLNRES
jgi:hypothetical protein